MRDDRPDSADEIFAEFLDRRERGQESDFDAVCAAHPELADELRALHADWEQLGLSGQGGPHESVQVVDPESDPAAWSGFLARLEEKRPERERYQLRGELAQGGMGAIVRVYDEDLRRNLAMKVILGKGQALETGDTPGVHPKVLGRFLEEAQVTAQLDHPGIVPVHELGLDPAGKAFFTMKLVKGEDLRFIFDKVRASEQGWTQTRALNTILRACEAVAFAHERGVVHRDLKPANIMVGRFGEVYVMDWGLAKVLGQFDHRDLRLRKDAVGSTSMIQSDRKDTDTPDSPLVTMDGDVVGTPAYMSPEQAQGELAALGPHSDVYGIGAVLYELLTGRMPYSLPGKRMSARTILAQVLNGPPEPIQRVNPNIPAELISICEQAMEREIPDRYSTMGELAADLQAYLEDRVVSAYATGPLQELRKWIRRNRALALAALALMVVSIVGALVSLTFAVGEAEQKARADRRALDAMESEQAEQQARQEADRRRDQAQLESYAANIALAQLAFQNHDLAGARKALENAPEPYRGFEWSYLDRALDQSVGEWQAHATRINDLAFDARGERLVTGSTGGSARVWDFNTGELLLDLDVGHSPVRGVGFTPNGGLAAATHDGWLRIFDATGTLLSSVGTGADFCSSLSISPDGSKIATSHRSGRLLIRDLQTMEVQQEIVAHDGWYYRLAFSADGRRVFSGGWKDHRVTAHDVESGRLIWGLDVGSNVVGLVTGGDPETLVCASFVGLFTLDPVDGGRMDYSWELPPGLHAGAGHLAISKSGESLVAVQRNRIDVMGLGSRTATTIIPTMFSWSPKVAMHPDGWAIARGADDGKVSIWYTRDNYGLPVTWRQHDHPGGLEPNQCDLDATLRLFAHGRDDGKVDFWDLTTDDDAMVGRRIRQARSHQGRILGLMLTPDGATCVTAGQDGFVCRQSVSDEKVLDHVQLGEPLRSVAINDSGTLIAAGTESGRIHLLDAACHQVGVLEGHGRAVVALEFSRSGSALVSGGQDTSVRLWDVAGRTQRALATPLSEAVLDVTFDPAGNRVAIGGSRGSLAILRAEDLESLWVRKGHRREVSSVAFSPDGATLVTGSWDNFVRFWNVASATEVYSHQTGWLRDVGFSEDGRSFWELRSGASLLRYDTRNPADARASHLWSQVLDRLNRGESLLQVQAQFAAAQQQPAHRLSWQQVCLALRKRLDQQAAGVAGRIRSTSPEGASIDLLERRLDAEPGVAPAVKLGARRLLRDQYNTVDARTARLLERLLMPTVSPRETNATVQVSSDLVLAVGPGAHMLAVHALALYRDRQFENCLEALKSAHELRLSYSSSSVPLAQQLAETRPALEIALEALALQASGRAEEAARLRRLFEQEMAGTRWLEDTAAQAMVPEVRAAFAVEPGDE